jgi:hypothetical protein
MNSIIKEKEKEKIMNKQIRKELRQLKKEKSFLENKLRWAVNDLNFFHELEQKDDEQKTINYLDISWVQYAEITERIKALKYDLRNWKLVR